MRPSLYFLSAFPVAAMLMSGAAAAETAVGHLESVSILPAGPGASLAARTSLVSAMVAATSIDSRSVVIELVGIIAERQKIPISDGSGMISQVAIDTVAETPASAVTRIRVSLARAYRHRVRIAGPVVYVDFERAEEPAAPVVAARRPTAAPVRSETAAPPPLARAAPTVSASPSPPPVEEARKPATKTEDLLSRWLAIREHLQHAPTAAASASADSQPWIPLVLKDGGTLLSYGDYAEVDQQFAFLLPFDAGEVPRVEAVAIKGTSIDREATTRAAESIRATRYEISRAPADFAALTDHVSATLDAVPSEPDPLARVRIVEDVRRRLIEWPAQHYDYRARDIQNAVSLLDPILSELRAAAGVPNVDLTISAGTPKPAPRLAMQPPTLIDLLENAIRVAALITPAQRTPILRATADALRRHRNAVPKVWLGTVERRVTAALKNELELDEAYDKLSRDLITRAQTAAAKGDVRAIAALQTELMERDRKLGGQREEIVASVTAALQAQFNTAAQIRLQRDRESSNLPPR
jgi:hypothetical protein